MGRELAIPDPAKLISRDEARRVLGGTIYWDDRVHVVAWRMPGRQLLPVWVDRHGMEYPYSNPAAEAMVLREAVDAALRRRHARRVAGILAAAAWLAAIAVWLFAARGCP